MSKPSRQTKSTKLAQFCYEFPPSTENTPNHEVAASAKKKAKQGLQEQIQLEQLKQENLRLELEILTKKEMLINSTNQPPPRAELPSAANAAMDQAALLSSLVQELTPPSKAEKQQLTSPTFPVMRQIKSSDGKAQVFSPKGTLDYEKLDISEFVYAFVDFIQQQPQTEHAAMLEYLQLLMEKAMSYTWSSVRNFNLSINNALSQGRLAWDQVSLIQTKSTTFFTHGDLRSSQSSRSNSNFSRQQRDTPKKEPKVSFCLDWNYSAKCACDIRNTRTIIVAKFVTQISILCCTAPSADIPFLPLTKVLCLRTSSNDYQW